MQVPLIRLQCGVNSYDWGKVGHDSAAAKFAAATPADGFEVQSEKPYAELWMGTHPSNPSKDVSTGRDLNDLVQDNKSLMTSEIHDKYNDKLPFLFKVLSINKALSIQAHPNKKLAEQLHAKDSKNYPDDNHKPEMTIAITDFEGLCGFRPLQEIAHFLQTVPALRQLVGDDEAKNFEETIQKNEESANKKALQSLFKKLMQSSKSDLETATPKLVSQAEKEGSAFAGNGGQSNKGEELSELVTRLNGQFPNDIGLFVLFFLNYVKMVPGEAMFLQADDIHAYISGDVVECMAASDNVIRAGFTPKFKDVDTLVSCLTYNYAPISEQKMKPEAYPYVKINQKGYSSGSEALLYDPPIEEFAVVRLELAASEAKATFEGISGPSIIICTQGSGKISVGPKTEELKTGYVYFVGATAELVIESNSDEHLVAFKAFCEIQEHSKQ